MVVSSGHAMVAVALSSSAFPVASADAVETMVDAVATVAWAVAAAVAWAVAAAAATAAAVAAAAHTAVPPPPPPLRPPPTCGMSLGVWHA